jgi:hypothetical protein
VRLRAAARDGGTPDVVEEYTGLRDDALIAVEAENGNHSVVVLCGRDEQGRVKWLHWGRVALRR